MSGGKQSRDNFWRPIAIISVMLNIVSVAVVIFAVCAYGANLAAIRDAVWYCGAITSEKFDSIAAAALTGRLDVVSLVVTIIGVLVAVFAFTGFFVFRREAREIARSEARDVAPEALGIYMDGNGAALLSACLNDAGVVARLQQRVSEIGIEDTETAEQVDEDPAWQPAP